jgi:transposase
MRFVPIKSDEQLDMQSLHRARERWVRNRTALLNQIRGLLLERGITIRKGRRHAEEALPAILQDAEANLTGMMRQLLSLHRFPIVSDASAVSKWYSVY